MRKTPSACCTPNHTSGRVRSASGRFVVGNATATHPAMKGGPPAAFHGRFGSWNLAAEQSAHHAAEEAAGTAAAAIIVTTAAAASAAAAARRTRGPIVRRITGGDRDAAREDLRLQRL